MLKSLQCSAHSLQSLSRKRELVKRLSFCLDIQNYYDYFDHLWFKGGGQITTVGDITPSYCSLPAPVLSDIKRELERRGFTVKVIFLMRDPIERIWSMVRMIRRNKLKSNPSLEISSELKHLERIYVQPGCEANTRYEMTVTNLELVFDQENIFYSCYENLFEDETIDQLAAFLGLADFTPDKVLKVNNSDKSESLMELNEELASKLFSYYRETYEFCFKRFGIKELWPGWKYS
ncbi:MAG: hypothetical protein WED33_02895 [Bacteroidia bacterium]